MRARGVRACPLGQLSTGEAGALQIVEISGPALMDGADSGRDAAAGAQFVLRSSPASFQPTTPPPGGPFSSTCFLLPARSPSVKPCPEADLLQRTARLREPFLAEKPH